MSIIMVILFLLCSFGTTFAQENKYFDDYISISKTNAIKGFFVILVFFRHYSQYVKLVSDYDRMFKIFNGYIGQLIVTMFLFYSGFGVMESIKKKGIEYIKMIPSNRALRTLFHFDIVVIMFLIVNIILGGGNISVKRFFLSLVGWNAIGNSNWYIFAMVLLYIITFISFMVCNNRIYIGAFICLLLSIVLILILIPFRPNYCYNTILCYPLGVWFSILKTKFEEIVKKNDICYFSILFFLLLCFFYLDSRKNNGTLWYELLSVIFVLIIVLVTMKVSFDNGLLQFLGKHIFSIYMLQRLPMLFLAQNKVVNLVNHPYIFFLISAINTIVISLIFDKVIEYVDLILFKRKN